MALTHELSKLVVRSLALSGITTDMVLQGDLQFTMLPWQTPPLRLQATILGVSLEEYLNPALSVKPEGLYELWTNALAAFKHRPGRILDEAGYYRTASYALPKVRAVERPLHLSTPESVPHVTDNAATTLSLEVAHLLRFNAPITEFVESDSDYYAVLPESSFKVGIVGGVPAVCSDQWDMSVSGLVPDLLEAPRGVLWEGSDYDIISRVRSTLHTCRGKFKDFDGLDWALQALRILQGSRELLDQVHKIKSVKMYEHTRVASLRNALDIAKNRVITDRQRLDALRACLVPAVISVGVFSREIYPYYSTPGAFMRADTLAKIISGIEGLLKQAEATLANSN